MNSNQPAKTAEDKGQTSTFRPQSADDVTIKYVFETF